MDDKKHVQSVQSTITTGAIDNAEIAAIALLLPRVTLGWISLQLGWGAMHRTPLPPLDGTWLLAMGLTLSGIALVLGLLTGPAAFASGTLGVASWEQSGVPTASIMVALAVLLVIAWRCAGEIGLDRWLLPSIGLAGYRGALVTRGSSRTTHGKNKKWAVDRHVCSRKEAGRGEVAR